MIIFLYFIPPLFKNIGIFKIILKKNIGKNLDDLRSIFNGVTKVLPKQNIQFLDDSCKVTADEKHSHDKTQSCRQNI